MFNLSDINLSFMMLSPEHPMFSTLENNHRNNTFLNMLYSMNYSIFPVYAYDKGTHEKNYLAVCSEDNDKLREEAIFMMNQFGKNEIIIKYK